MSLHIAGGNITLEIDGRDEIALHSAWDGSPIHANTLKQTTEN